MLLVLLACASDAPSTVPVAPTPTPAARLAARPAEAVGPTLAVGGDVQLGRRTNAVVTRTGVAAPLGEVTELASADLAYVNLECVAATGGEYRADKGERGPYYYRTRPEHLEVLRSAGVDVVGTANNHAGDYGPPALLEQASLLDRMGLGHPGAGADRAAACAPVFRTVGDLVVAFYAVEATMVPFAATDTRAGTCYLDPERTEDWAAFAKAAVAESRDRAHLVMLGVHWGDNNVAAPTDPLRRAAHAVIGAGFDAILGSSAHLLHGVEVIEGRPVIYDAGNLLFDARSDTESAIFTLTLGPHGVRQVRVRPLHADFAVTRRPEAEAAAKILSTFADRSGALGTAVWTDGVEAVIPLPDAPARPAPTVAVAANPAPVPAVAAAAPDADCLADEVPADARRPPVRVGPVTLVGARVGPATMKKREMVDVETWWTVDAPLPAPGVLLDVQARLVDGGPRWSGDHDGCDWTWPTDRWQPGQVYHDRYALRPVYNPGHGTYAVTVGVADEPLKAGRDDVEIGRFEVRGSKKDD